MKCDLIIKQATYDHPFKNQVLFKSYLIQYN